MAYSFTLSRRKLLGNNGLPLTATTITIVSGLTLDQRYVNSNTYPTNLLPNNYPPLQTPKNVSRNIVLNQDLNYKSIVLPIEITFNPTDYSDLIQRWTDSEVTKSINPIEDGETSRFYNKDGLKIEFRFADRTTTTVSSWNYVNDYEAAGFIMPDESNLNRFTRSYFRLYFYDSTNTEKQNLLFTEDIPVTSDIKSSADLLNLTPTLNFNRLFWLENDSLMFNNNSDRVVYMDARFFNAKTGQVHVFNNIPKTNNTPIDVATYSSNPIWRTVPITLRNPNNENGDYIFKVNPIPNRVVSNAGGTTITMSEFILE
tara:strand:+ start:636 stop:1577 length:942 start_codon:yes stop_codon:yes gene_type:complete